MRTAGQQMDTHKGERLLTAFCPVLQGCRAYTLAHTPDNVGLVFSGIAEKEIIHPAFRRERDPVYNSKVFLAEASVSDLAAERCCSVLRAGKNHQPADNTVQTVNRADRCIVISERAAHERRHSAGLVRRKHAAGFDAYQNIIVRKYQFHKPILPKVPAEVNPAAGKNRENKDPAEKEDRQLERDKTRQTTRTIAFCAMMAALSTVIMLTGGLIPVFTYCSPLLASVLLIPVLEEYGARWAWMVWAVSAGLSMMIGVDKEAAFFYLFLGWYPILKPVFDRIPSKILGFTIKTSVFASAIGVMYALICFVFQIGDIVSTFSPAVWVNVLFFVMLIAVMLLFDRTLIGLRTIYRRRFQRKIRK